MLCLLFPTTHRQALMALLLIAACVLPGLALAQGTQEKMLTQVRQWVAQTQNTTPAQVEIAPLDGRVQVQPCPQPLQMDLPFASRETVRVRCAQPPWQPFGSRTPYEMCATTVQLVHTVCPVTPGSVLNWAYPTRRLLLEYVERDEPGPQNM